jgi:hypothetical protein
MGGWNPVGGGGGGGFTICALYARPSLVISKLLVVACRRSPYSTKLVDVASVHRPFAVFSDKGCPLTVRDEEKVLAGAGLDDPP